MFRRHLFTVAIREKAYMEPNKYEAQYGNGDVRDAVNRAIADGWVIGSIDRSPKRGKPKRGKSEGLFAFYKLGMPASEYVRLAEAFPARKVRGTECLRWDLVHGYITLAPVGGQICLARLDAPPQL